MPRFILAGAILALIQSAACQTDTPAPGDGTTGPSASSDATSSSGFPADDLAPATTSGFDGSTTGASTDTGTSGVTSDGDVSSSTTGAASIEIAGNWLDDFGGEHQISDTKWIDVFGEDMFPYTIDHYDNDADVAIAQDDGDGTWSKFEWIQDGEAVWYCQSAFGLKSAQAAMAAPDADSADPATGGCGGFAWSALHPA